LLWREGARDGAGCCWRTSTLLLRGSRPLFRNWPTSARACSNRSKPQRANVGLELEIFALATETTAHQRIDFPLFVSDLPFEGSPAPKEPSRAHTDYGRSSISYSSSPLLTKLVVRARSGGTIGPSTCGAIPDKVGGYFGIVGFAESGLVWYSTKSAQKDCSCDNSNTYPAAQLLRRRASAAFGIISRTLQGLPRTL